MDHSNSSHIRITILRSLICILALMFWGQALQGQTPDKRQQKANRYFQEGSYHRAIPYYLKVLRKDFNVEAMRSLAECYRQTRNFPEAAKWYGYVVNTQHALGEDHLIYGQLLMRLQRYEEARDQFMRFQKMHPRDERANRFFEAALRNQRAPREAVNYEIAPLPFNSPEADFSPFPYQGGILFTSGRIRDKVVQRSSDRDGRPFFDLYQVMPNDSGGWGRPQLIKGRFNTKFHEASAVYEPEQQLFFFTRNNYLQGKLRAGKDGKVRLKIFFAGLDEKGDWTQLNSLPFNSEDHSVGHPALSNDGKTLFFASNMQGGYGGTDLWSSTLSDTGWSAPVNLGPLVNTVGDELFPTIQADGNLYFSSNGQGGAGGLDLFMARPTPNGWGDIRRLPAPINSPADDFGYILSDDGETGFFSSDRAGGAGLDDIYAFRVLNPSLFGLLEDVETKQPVQGAVVTVTDLSTGEEKHFQTQSDGRFGAILSPQREYQVRIQRSGYVEQQISVNTLEAQARGRQDLRIAMEQPGFVLEGVVSDEETGYTLNGARIRLVELDMETWSGPGGAFHFDVEPHQKVTIEATRTGYLKDVEITKLDLPPGIHRFSISLEMEPDLGKIDLRGQVIDASDNPVPGVDLFLINKDERKEVTGQSDRNGAYGFTVVPSTSYQLVARHPGYRTSQKTFDTPPMRVGTILKNIRLSLSGAGRPNVLENIYYDYGESYLRDDVLGELDKLVRLMKMNPGKRIVISSSTDSRGSDSYNLALSQRRAEAVARYLISKGIDKDRVEAIGYGETRLVNECGNGVDCTEAQHQANRRTEFTLLPERKTKFKGSLLKDPKPIPASRKVEAPAQPVKVADGNYLPMDPEKPVCYRVQVGVFREKDKSEFRARLGDLAEELHIEPLDTGLYRYQLGECLIYARAKDVYRVAQQQKGMQDAFIAAYQEGKRVGIPKEMEKPELEE